MARIVAVAENLAEPHIHCTVYLALTRGERMDSAIQKCVELGAVALRLFPSARSIVKYDDKTLAKKRLRWGKIALEAAKQSGRGIVPPVALCPDFSSAMTEAGKADLPLFFYENEARHTLRRALEECPNVQTVSLVTGPEGGFTDEEVSVAESAGLRPLTLGKRILRCETAPVAALAGVMLYLDA